MSGRAQGSGKRRNRTLTQKAFLNTLAAGLDYGARIIVGFVITPFLVRGMGEFAFGAWRFLLSLTGYMTAAGGRPTQALRWTLATMPGDAAAEARRAKVGSALRVTAVFAPLVIAAGAAAAYFIPSWIDASAEFHPALRWAVAILTLNILLASLSDVPRAILEGENLGYRRMGLTAVLAVLNGALMVLAVKLETGLIGVATATATTTVLTGALFLRVVRKNVEWLGISRPTREDLQGFFGLSGWFLAWRLVMRFMTAADVVLLGLFASVELVATYSLSRYIPEALVSVLGVAVFGIAPGLGRVMGEGNLPKASRLRAELLAGTWFGVTVLGIEILLWNGPFVGLWVGERHFAGVIENALLVVMMIQLIFIRTDANVIDLTLDLRRKVLLGVVSTVVAVALAVGLMTIFDLGIRGACIGLIGGRAILSLAYPVIVGRHLGLSGFGQLRGTIRPGVVTASLFVAATWANGLASEAVDGWLSLIAAVALSLPLVAMTCFFAGLSPAHRRFVRDRAEQLVMSRWR